ncbi:IS110 family transposase [Paraburkholderia sp. Ac-20342]|uniref:IS110 family transposase n=1 Tax=Paraburkholderia sp. Ac-20342 TaxID=2703889 RepID=UPI00197FB747|nr:IS110 family transposase [Paraburkholderia sp. Ac-20342]MBN3851721.1 IS110 family transposase [Paraburkholderia sp. Ac-20342]
MEEVTLVGIDLGKHSFHLHAQDRKGKEIFRRKVTRRQLVELFVNFPACTIAMEACAGAHFMARTLAGFGHQVRLIAPHLVRPFVKSNKNDFADAEAICEAASRPSMRFVTPRTEPQQTLSALHRVRESFVRERVCTGNQVHGILLEFGISLPVGCTVLKRLPAIIAQYSLPPRLVVLLERLHAHYKYLDEQIAELDKDLVRQLGEDDLGQRLLTIPGVGPITASVLSSEVGDGKQYRSSRDFAASIGLVPRQHSTGGKANLLGISKRGDKNIRRLLVQCARSYMRDVARRAGPLADWVRTLLARRHSSVVACALANKLARIAWAIAARHTVFETAGYQLQKG